MPFFAAPLGTLTATANQWRQNHPFANEEPNAAPELKQEKHDDDAVDVPKAEKKKPEQVEEDSSISSEKGPSAPERGENTSEKLESSKIKESASSTPFKIEESAHEPSKREEHALEPPATKEDIVPEPPKNVEESVHKQEKASRVQRLRTRVADIVRGRKRT